MTETESEFTAMSAEADRLSEMVKAYREQDDAIRAYFGGKRDGRDTIEILMEAFQAKWSEEDTLFEAMLDHKTAELKEEIERLRAALSQIVEHCDNPGAWNEIVQERIIERCEETARAALAGSPPAEQPAPPSPWLPIETAPNDGSMIIQLLRNNTAIIGPSSQVDATHWMPIPPPPEAGE